MIDRLAHPAADMSPMHRLGIAAAVTIALLAPADASAAPVVQEFPLPVTDAKPGGITAGPGGTLWFVETNKNRVRSITLDGTVSGPITARDAPTGIASAFGGVWITEPGGSGHVARALPGDTTVAEFTVSANPAEPQGITLGPDGLLWYADHKRDVIGRVTSLGDATDVASTQGSKPWDIAVGADSNLWFTEQGGNGTIGRITSTGAVTSFPIPTAASEPTEIVAGADGALWFTERAADKIGRITTNGQVTEYSGMSGSQPSGIALGADGNVWFTEESGRIGRITPTGAISDWAAPASAEPHGITLGPDGNLWFGDQGLHAIGRITSGPAVAPSSVTDAAQTTATLRGVVRPAAQATTYYFEYGQTGSYGATTAATNAGSGTSPVDVASAVAGLAPGTTYHYRAVAANGTDTTRGPDRTFTTTATPENPGSPPMLDQTPPTHVPDPTPVLGRTVVVGAAQGVVTVKLKGTKNFVPLTGNVSVPTGSELDAAKGTVKLLSALDSRGHVQTGTFNGGRFMVKQSKSGKGMTDLYLRGPKPGRCAAPNRATASAQSKNRKRSLWGKDNKGRFRTHGKDSVATVRGTRWLTEDRCDGTLTRVTQGSVVVKDLRRKRTKVVRAGHSYLARRR
jgi:streptogramin lyase